MRSVQAERGRGSPRVLTSTLSWYLHRNAKQRYPQLVDWMVRRGQEELLVKGQGARKAAPIEAVLREASVLDLDDRNFAGWGLAAEIWAACRRAKPAIQLSDADLLVTATAVAHNRQLVTVDGPLRANLARAGFASRVQMVET